MTLRLASHEPAAYHSNISMGQLSMTTNGQALQTAAHLQIIGNTHLFKGLTLEKLTAVLNQAQYYNFPSQSFIFHQYDKAENIYVILKGQVSLSQTTLMGKQVIINMLGAGDDVAILSVFENAIYPLTAEAVTDCLLLGWTSQTMQQLMEQFPRIALNALKSVTGRFVELQDRYRELATERVEQRIAHALLRLSQKHGQSAPGGVLLKLPNSRQMIAEMTGTTLYTVSRTCRHWEELGLIQSGREQVTILNPVSLSTIAQELPQI